MREGRSPNGLIPLRSGQLYGVGDLPAVLRRWVSRGRTIQTEITAGRELHRLIFGLREGRWV